MINNSESLDEFLIEPIAILYSILLDEAQHSIVYNTALSYTCDHCRIPRIHRRFGKASKLFDDVAYQISKWPITKALASHEFTSSAYKSVKCPSNYSDVALELGGHISQIVDGLYLGDICAAHSLPTMKKHKIDSIVNMCINCPNKLEADIETKHLGIRDAVDENLMSVLHLAIEYIDKQIEFGRRVFIHCKAGVSRSGAVTVAYIMYKNRWPYDKALEYVRASRAIVNPNKGFVNTLKSL